MCRSSLHEGSNAQVVVYCNQNPRLFNPTEASPCNNHDYEILSTKYMTNGESNFSRNLSSKSCSMLCDMLVSSRLSMTTDDESDVISSSPAETKEDAMMVMITNQKSCHKKKKQVSIHMQVQLRLIIARHDMSTEEYNATWYSQEEYAKITESCCKQIAMLNRGEVLKDKKYCSRGLETHTKTRSRAKSMTRSLARQTVLREQERQRQEGIRHEDALAHLYHSASSSCQLWANLVGLDDQKEADITYDEFDHDCFASTR